MFRILIVEDNAEDVELMNRELKAAGLTFESKHVETKEEFLGALDTYHPDLVLADYALPSFNALEALALLESRQETTPLILVSGAIGKELAAAVVGMGAADFVSKDRIFRLREVVQYAAGQKERAVQSEQGRRLALTELKRSTKTPEPIGDEPVRILLLEDRPEDVLLLEACLKKELPNYVLSAVDNEEDFRKELLNFNPDIILADFSLPSFDGLSVLKIRQRFCPETPFLFVSSIIGEEVAIESLKLGVTDYVMKEKLSRLPAAVKRALAETRERRMRRATESMLAERQEIIRCILECASDAVITMDNTGVLTSVNPAFEHVFGYTEGESIGQKFEKFVPEPSLTMLRSEKRQCTGTEVIGRRKDGTEVTLDISTSEIKVMGTAMVTATIRDISERTKLHKQLRDQVRHLENLNGELKEARDQAQQALVLKSQFVANISHEIRTPMSGVLGMAELLLMSQLDQESHVISEHIYLSAKSLLSIVNDILDFSKLEAGKVQLEKRMFKVSSLIEQVVQSIKPSAASKQLTIETDIDDNTPEELWGDDGRIKQTLLNLAHNAIKFTESGSVKIGVKTESVKNEIVQVRFSVTDTGIGIPQDIQTKLFLPFVQADSSTTRKFGGTGLGLSICKSLIALMSGDLGVESVEGEGSTFWVTLPLQIPSAISETRTESSSSRK